ncbi:signal peptidase II [Sphingomonas psychrolutea]|uniref:Lipoprotein signal peptidase n=1 Tax=Sphingomonas psychrolutea TaxID=1259676 RepID=A0ABQ1G1V4_9SPHN|nr:signal peptidase II [Sphingomonas psychrolutea]GGA35212.1 lipoprotein signal peptidase [Sphingomonas psychrolutea]
MKLPFAGFATAALLFVADQATKYGVTDVMRLNELTNAHYVTEFFNVRFVANRGVSLGLMRADDPMARWLLVAMTGAIALGVLVWMLRERNRIDQIGLGLVLGGAIGNILDRIRFSYVVDWADLHFGSWQPFLVFNLADAAITIGVLILFARALLVRDAPKAESGTDSGPNSASEQGVTETHHA